MSRIIASVYEIVQEIGSGGGGIVYLGRHLRLGKWVVLKADRRTISAKPEVLRREVDALKNLNHTYIPQVYDFVVEDGVVYTVMDYIEGESLDKLLKRGERPSQPEVIKWACQLLEALRYLHSRPPYGILHGDLKPSNIMLTPEGDIRLIDFNIALALGEEGAVRVGFSRGYASPEHYGLDYTKASTTQGIDEDVRTALADNQAETVLPNPKNLSSSSSGGRGVLLDVRSDIYSLGATLYHLLTGIRPASDAKNVEPIAGKDGVSPAVAAIIKKAMEPDPNLRYQSADEMLYAFEHLHEDDPRSRRYRWQVKITAVALAAVFLAGGICSFIGLRQMQAAEAAARAEAERAEAEERAERTALEFTTNAGEALSRGDIPSAINSAMSALELDTQYNAQAQALLTDALGVYDLSDGFKSHLAIDLPSEPLEIALSPERSRLAAIYAYQVVVFDTQTGERLLELPVEESALSGVIFLDEDRIVYAAPGAVRAYDISQESELWSGGPATKIACSADGKRIAAVYKDSREGNVYDTETGMVIDSISFQGRQQYVAANDSFADPDDNLLTLNADGSLLAASFADGSVTIFTVGQDDNNLEILDPSAYTHFEGGFYGPYFAFSATGEGEAIFAVIDTEQILQTRGFSSQNPFFVQADEHGTYVATDNILVGIHPITGEQTEVAYTETDITGFRVTGDYALVATDDNTYSFFGPGASQIEQIDYGYSADFLQLSASCAVVGSRDTPTLRTMELERHSDAQVFFYAPDYPHDEARISADGTTVMLFRYDAFRLYSVDGQVLAEVEIPDAEQVYDQQYRRDENGSYLEVIYNNGLRRAYSAQNGAVLWEQQGEQPDLTLYEEFFTDHWRITAPLHETPEVYDLESGQKIGELEADAYLTYVTQVGDYVITEYISAQGERYGLLLNENCETLTRLPNLCDIVDGELIFDYPSGDLRRSRIYSLQELYALAETQKGGLLR